MCIILCINCILIVIVLVLTHIDIIITNVITVLGDEEASYSNRLQRGLSPYLDCNDISVALSTPSYSIEHHLESEEDGEREEKVEVKKEENREQMSTNHSTSSSSNICSKKTIIKEIKVSQIKTPDSNSSDITHSNSVSSSSPSLSRGGLTYLEHELIWTGTGEMKYQSDFNQSTHPSSSYMHRLQKNDIHVYNVLCTINMINKFKELYRLDLNIPSEMKWRTVLAIFYDCILPHLSEDNLLKDLLQKHTLNLKDVNDENMDKNNYVTANNNNNKDLEATDSLLCHEMHISSSDSPVSNGHNNNNGNDIRYSNGNSIANKYKIKGGRSNSNSSDSSGNNNNSKNQFSSTNSNRSIWNRISSNIHKRIYCEIYAKIIIVDKNDEELNNKNTFLDKNSFLRTEMVRSDKSTLGLVFGVDPLLGMSSALFTVSNGLNLWKWTSNYIDTSERVRDVIEKNDEIKDRQNDNKDKEGDCYSNNYDSSSDNIDSNSEKVVYIFITPRSISYLNGSPASKGKNKQIVHFLADKAMYPQVTLFDELCDALKKQWNDKDLRNSTAL